MANVFEPDFDPARVRLEDAVDYWEGERPPDPE